MERATFAQLMERINVLRRGGAVVDVVRVLVHVQGEDRRAAAEAVGVIGGPLAHEPPTTGRVREQDQPEPPPIGPLVPRLIRPS